LGGRIYVGTGSGYQRVNSDGTSDASFSGSTWSGGVDCIAGQPDGKFVLGGTFLGVDSTAVKGIGRLNADRSYDAGFLAGTGLGGVPAFVQAIVVLADGKILIAGQFHGYGVEGSRDCNDVARLNPDGTLDSSFDTYYDQGEYTDYPIYSLAVQADGKILVAGEFTSVCGIKRACLARIFN
jgi:uncharacterized delta-60 repeat protein